MTRSIVTFALLLSAVAPLAAQSDLARVWDEARFAWDAGDYPASLRQQISLLEQGGDRYLREVALLTGELYHTVEIAADGRAPRWSADGRWLAYEVPGEDGVTTEIVEWRGEPRAAGTVTGRSLSFSPDGARAAYLHADGAVRVRDLATEQERTIELGGLRASQVVAGADAVYVVAGAEGSSETHVYAVREGAAPQQLTSGPGFRVGLELAPGAGRLLVGTVENDPRGRPFSPPARRFTVIDPATGAASSFDGTAPAFSRDGSVVAYLSEDDGRTMVNRVRLAGGEAISTEIGEWPIAAPALSPDGRRILVQGMPFRDWEIYLIDEGLTIRQVTNEIQHDLFPRFLDVNTVLAVKGESRHRRSYLYDVETGQPTRLFHNNTVRTIAPEYEWAASPDGRRILIVAERDGDTVSPERGLYLVDRDRRVTGDELRARLQAMLAAETALRERAARMTRPAADRIGARTAEISMERLYDYQRAMFDFGSKYITQPGNRLAIEYIAETLRSFGYEPELQWFEAQDRRTGRTMRTANVIATLPGTENPELVYVVSSHFDSVERGPGADDNTSGTSVLLETARVLAQHPQPATIQFAFFTGEEAGLLGSREFVRRAVADDVRIVGALNNDMLGWSNDQRLDNTIRYSNPGIRDLQHAAALVFSDLITYDALYYKNTDAHAYYEVYGDIVGGIGSYPVLGNPNYHQATDRLETMNHELIRETARANTASIMLLASSPSRLTGLELVPARTGVEARWTASPERGVGSYEVVYGPAGEPARHRVEVREPRALLPQAEPGWVVSVRASGARQMHGWDWARGVVEGS